ncbi:SDR family NAD(P)-dependent oxidoreductase [Flavobacterium pallidum]|uniref:Gluconate 5-dehydrogenase n=1 Tax=Flavobacterium pallidum TaxID=2172098 RepID=A0A2S1SDM1_9FLAO|nr:SDR family oxidoreductase [Flavobacterium pallidum]AWI24462.1 gluconate 5-dehydrogenase [Flavobacterium pallidum]
MIQTFSLTGKTVVITGGYGYLGKAITESLRFHGALVYVLGRNEESFENTFEDKDNLFFQTCDVSETASIQQAFEAINKVRPIDILINNAFFSKGQSPETMSDEDWATGIDGTLNSVFKCIREIIPYFKASGSGKIINVSSMYGMVAPQFEVYDDFPQFLNPPHYGAAKAGILQLTRYYANYLGKYNINVNAVTPGPFPSGTVQETEGFIKALEVKTSLGRIGKPEDLAGAFVFLASGASNFITGQNIVVDGGWTSK